MVKQCVVKWSNDAWSNGAAAQRPLTVIQCKWSNASGQIRVVKCKWSNVRACVRRRSAVAMALTGHAHYVEQVRARPVRAVLVDDSRSAGHFNPSLKQLVGVICNCLSPPFGVWW